MNRKFGLLAFTLVAGIGIAPAQTTPAQTPIVEMPRPEDVKIETVSLAPGIYILNGRGGNVGLTVGVDGAAIIDDQFADMAPKIRAAVAMLSDQPVGGSELDAGLPLLIADPLAYGRCLECIADCHAILQFLATLLSATVSLVARAVHHR